MGAGLLSFVLSYTEKMSPPEIREASFASRLVTKSIVFLPYKYFPDFRWWFINSSQTTYEGRGFGRYLGGQNWDRIFEKTRVGFGRTELSLRLSWTEFCTLIIWAWSQGRRFLWGVVQGGFSCFSGGSKIREKNSLNFSDFFSRFCMDFMPKSLKNRGNLEKNTRSIAEIEWIP